MDTRDRLTGCEFIECRFDSLVIGPDDEHTYDPALILRSLRKLGASIPSDESDETPEAEPDERIKLMERFLRVFLRHTHVDEEFIRVRLGKGFASMFFDQILPVLLARRILEETPWRGQGVQRRFKLVKPMAQIGAALEASRGDFEEFLGMLARG